MENPNILNKKYQNLAGSKEVSRAVEETKKDKERVSLPHSKIERTQAYLNRIEKLIDDPRGWELLSHKITKDFTLNLEDEEVLQKTINILHKIDVQTAIEGGQGREVQQTQGLSQEKINETYRSGAFERLGSQEQSVNEWLDYLKQNDADYPMWFRYLAMRNLKKMGRLDKEEGEYSKRSKSSIDSFPDLNAEALAFVYRTLDKGLGSKEYVYNSDIHTEEEKLQIEAKRVKVEQLLQKKDFAGLYAFSQLETSGASNRESLEGEWKVFEQNSEPEILVETLEHKGTGWCTASGSAPAHLKGGDFHVYYTKGDSGVYSEPRVAIRMENGVVREVRGVEHKQNLEPALVEIAQERYTSLPGGDKFEKKSEDMARVTEIVKRTEKSGDLNTEDLRFLYELDGKIEGFGYQRDLRLDELLKNRDTKEDLVSLFNCRFDQIAKTYDEALSGDIVYYGGTIGLSGRISAEGLTFPKQIGGHLYLNGLTSTEGLILPEYIGGRLGLDGLRSAKGLVLPAYIGGHLALESLSLVDKEMLREKYPQHASKI